MMRIEVELDEHAYKKFEDKCALLPVVEEERNGDLWRKVVTLPLGKDSILVYGPWR